MRAIAKCRNAGDNHRGFNLIRSISGYRTRADERSWRRVAYRTRQNRPWDWIFGAAFITLTVLTGLVQTQQHLGAAQSELETAKRTATLMKAQAAELAKRSASLTLELEEANAQRGGLQTKLKQVTSETESVQFQLKNKQSQLEETRSELETAKQNAALRKAQAAELAKRSAILNSELEKANAQSGGLQTKLQRATSETESVQFQLLDKQSQLEETRSKLEDAKLAADQAKAQAMDFAKMFASLNTEREEANAQLSASYIKVGDVLMSQGNLADALKSYLDGLAIADRWTKANPGNVSWQRGLAISQSRVALALAKQGDTPRALDMLRKGRVIIARLAEQSPNNPQLSKDLAMFDDNIVKLKPGVSLRPDP